MSRAEALSRLRRLGHDRTLAALPQVAVLTVIDADTLACFLSPAELDQLAQDFAEYQGQE
jgi:hypothetical protein